MSAQEYLLKQVTSKESAPLSLCGRMVLIGSCEECDIRLDDSTIPDIAAKLEPQGTTYFIEPVGKSQVLVNGRKCRLTPLSPGDRIQIGSHIFTFEKSSTIRTVAQSTDSDLLQRVYKLIEAIGIERNLSTLLQNLISTLTEITGGSEVFLFKLDHNNKPGIFLSTSSGSSEERFSDTIVQQVLSAGTGICIPNALSDPSCKGAQSISDLKLLSVICSPIKVTGKMLGLIYVGSRTAGVSFCKQDLDYLNLYATIAGMLIQHVDYITQQNDSFLRLGGTYLKEGVIAESKIMQNVLASVHSVAASDISILLEGETGTGKSKFAHLIHQKSNRSGKPFVVVNCSALRGELLESELFGHKKGSFTGAIDDHDGLFAAAQGGTIFLDEIGELELPLQAKLLRTLETSTVRPLGSTKEIHIDVRVLCATNRNLAQMIKDNLFRSDLFYRINQFSIEIPPLRKRDDDLLLLAYYFLNVYKAQYPNREIFDFHPNAIRYIQHHPWPGNIRELSNSIHRAVLTSKSPLIRFEMHGEKAVTLDFEEATKRFQKELIQKAIDFSVGNKDEAARRLGMSRSTLYRYLTQLN